MAAFLSALYLHVCKHYLINELNMDARSTWKVGTLPIKVVQLHKLED